MRLRNWPRWQRWLNRRIPPASSVELNQRRVFILPTRQGGAFGLALLVMLLAAINYQNSLAYGLTFLLLSLVRESEINQKGKARKLWDIEEGKGI